MNYKNNFFNSNFVPNIMKMKEKNPCMNRVSCVAVGVVVDWKRQYLVTLCTFIDGNFEQ